VAWRPWDATAGAIAWIGAVPRFCDVRLNSALLDPERAAALIDERIRVVLPVHLYGQMADMLAFRALCDESGVALLEDGAQACAARRDGVRVGELGDACTFSFYPTKNLGAAGEAGMVLTRHETAAARLRGLRDHGMSAKYFHTSIGTNSRMDEIQAAVLNVKWPHLEGWNDRRRATAARYDRAFEGQAGIHPLAKPAGSGHVFHQYAVRIEGDTARDEVLEKLRKLGVNAAVHYPTPIHLQPAARPWGFRPGDFQNAEKLSREVLCLPVHPFLREDEVVRVIEALLEAAG